MKIYCISGKAQNGKDTTASLMREVIEETSDKRVLITHYADLLKYVCRTFFGWDGNKDEFGRTLLQYVATEKVRYHDRDFWVDFIARLLKIFEDEWDYVLIADTRFLNEVSVLKKRGFEDVTLVRVVRPNFDNGLTEAQKNHISETALDDIRPDIIFYNDSTIENLKKKVRKLILNEDGVSTWHVNSRTLEL